jgi:hypothetical protein
LSVACDRIPSRTIRHEYPRRNLPCECRRQVQQVADTA